jgi:hypothetical protein
MKPVYVEVLAREINGNAGELYPAMIALDDLGEPVFGSRTSLSILDEAEKRGSAKRYLDSLAT